MKTRNNVACKLETAETKLIVKCSNLAAKNASSKNCKHAKEADVDHRSYPMATLPVSDDNISSLDSALQVASATMDVIEISLVSHFFLVRDENNLAAYRS